MENLQERFKSALGYKDFLQLVEQTNTDYIMMMGGVEENPPINPTVPEQLAFDTAWEKLCTCMEKEDIETYCTFAENHKTALTEFLEGVHKSLSVVPVEVI
jgi:hypothetical protein